jgi:hypothetical protein
MNIGTVLKEPYPVEHKEKIVSPQLQGVCAYCSQILKTQQVLYGQKTEKPLDEVDPGDFSLLFLTARLTARPLNFSVHD